MVVRGSGTGENKEVIMSLSGYVRKRIGSRLYKPMISEDENYANRAAKLYRDDGFFVVVLPDQKRTGQFMVWRSVNPRRLKVRSNK